MAVRGKPSRHVYVQRRKTLKQISVINYYAVTQLMKFAPSILKNGGPQFSAVMKNLIAYIMPAVILIAIGGVIFIVRHQSRGNKLPSRQHDNQISDELQQQVEAELEKYKEQN